MGGKGVLDIVSSRAQNSLLVCVEDSPQAFAMANPFANVCLESSTQTNRLLWTLEVTIPRTPG